MAATVASLRADVVAFLRGVTGVGRVHDYRRMIRDEAQYKALLYDDASGWITAFMVMLSPASTPLGVERGTGHTRAAAIGQAAAQAGDVFTTFRFQIEGFMAVDDSLETAKRFEDLVFAIVQRFNATGLISTDAAVHMQEPTECIQIAHAMIANMFLVHYCRITVTLRART